MKLVIENLKPWDGSYDFDLEEFTRREWGWVKRFAGYLPGDVEKGFTGADPELWAVFAIIALHRAGRIQAGDASDIFERFEDGGLIRLEGDRDVEEDEQGLPPPESSRRSESPSGEDMPTTSEISTATLQGTGTHASGSSESGLLKLAT